MLYINQKSSSVVLPLIIILLLALFLRLYTAFAFPNIHWPDEIFQTLEPAHRLAYGNGIISWEWRDGVRSWVLPGIISGVMRLTGWMGEGSRGYIAGVTLFFCLLSLSPVLVGFFWGYRTGGLIAAIITAGACSVWFELVYFAPKALNEVVAAHLLLPGVYLAVHGQSFQTRTRFFLAGILLGLTIALRIHLIPAVAFAIVWVTHKDWRGKGLPLLLGILGPILVFGWVDALTWSYPFQSFWLNIWVNVVEKKSHAWGVFPWYTYFQDLIDTWKLPALGFICLLAPVGARRSPLLACLALVIVLTHSILAHKEYRFIYPALPMVIVLVGLGMAELISVFRRWGRFPKFSIIAVSLCLILWSFTSAVLAGQFDNTRAANIPESEHTNWTSFSGTLRAFQDLAVEETLCGLGISDWAWSGGYTYLHQNVPIFVFDRDDINIEPITPNFNYFLASKPIPPIQTTYELQKCWDRTCLYKRSGSCVKRSGYHINKLLQERGE